MRTFRIDRQWAVIQDVADRGEKFFLYMNNWSPEMAPFEAFSEWQPIDRLTHLQLLLADNPYFGRELRSFNNAPWWYRNEFVLPEGVQDRCATLRFEGVDYFCKVWLNGQFVGEHEGYFAPFEFEVAHLLKSGEPNLLVVKVWSPWDQEGLSFPFQGLEYRMKSHDMVKGTYDHADGFFQRDVNPVGIWREVAIHFHTGIRISETPTITTELAADTSTAFVDVVVPLFAETRADDLVLRCDIVDDHSGQVIASTKTPASVNAGRSELGLRVAVDSPRIWNTWDRGGPNLYTARISVLAGATYIQSVSHRFGIRTVKIRRTKDETTFLLNGKAIYLRGAAYFPDVYISKMDKARYLRDLSAMKNAGCNAVRIHIHVALPELYELCDELGLAVIQDSDLNWILPTTAEFKDRAVAIFGDMVKLLRNHASIICWICMNEPDIWNLAIEAGMVTQTDPAPVSNMHATPGPQIVEALAQLDPSRPYIKGSRYENDPESGDSHNYTGSLYGEHTHYTDIYPTREKLNTEFGIEAPAAAVNLVTIPEIHSRLRALVEGDRVIEDLQYYQYRLVKYYIEHYRIQKYRPCSGFFQFLFTDVCPQSFYGVYDWWGMPKRSLDAFKESSQPLGVFMEHKDKPVALWAVNDGLESHPGCTVEWLVTDQEGEKLRGGSAVTDIESDGAHRVTDFEFEPDPAIHYRVTLWLRDHSGRLLAGNVYEDAFHHPAHPKGHPGKLSHEFGMRVFSA